MQVPLFDATQIEMDAAAAARAQAAAPNEPAQLLDVLRVGQNASGEGSF